MENITALERRAVVWDASGGVCHYCGKVMHPIRDFTVDHVIPRRHGGTDAPGNLVAACRTCNASKQALRDRPKHLGGDRVETWPTPTPDVFLLDDGRDIAAMPMVSPRTVRWWLDSGALTGHRLEDGTGWRVREEDFRRFIDAHRGPDASKGSPDA